MMKGNDNHSGELPPASKSQRRREALELKSLASELIKLSPAKLGRVPLDDDVRSAIREASQFRSHGARKRQLQYVAKLLRRIDPEPIFRTMEAFDNEARQLTGRQIRSEAWRDYLLESGDRALGVLIKQRKNVDTQAIRQLVRNAHKETGRGKPPAATRALFRVLREMDELTPLPPVTGS
jgi:ribosome-associated protein